MNKVFRSDTGRAAVAAFYDQILASSPVEIAESDISTSFGGTHILKAGCPDNPPLLLIHGTASNSSSWMGALPELIRTHHVLMADIPGEPGKSEDSRFPCRGLNFCGWILEILDELNLERVILGGQSLGAWAVLLFALNYPGRADKLILVSPSGIARPRGSYLLKMAASLFRGEKGVRDMIGLLYNGKNYDESVYEFYKIMKEHCRYREDIPPLFSDDELKGLTVPFLYTAGDRDCLLNTEKTADRLSSCTTGGRYKIFEDTGHVVTGWEGEVGVFLEKEAAVLA